MIRLKILTVRKIINFVRCIGHKTYYANISLNTELFTFFKSQKCELKNPGTPQNPSQGPQ